jgi:hypothetical protein
VYVPHQLLQLRDSQNAYLLGEITTTAISELFQPSRVHFLVHIASLGYEHSNSPLGGTLKHGDTRVPTKDTLAFNTVTISRYNNKKTFTKNDVVQMVLNRFKCQRLIAPSSTHNSTFRPHSVFMCFVWISEQTAIISLYSIN